MGNQNPYTEEDQTKEYTEKRLSNDTDLITIQIQIYYVVHTKRSEVIFLEYVYDQQYWKTQ